VNGTLQLKQRISAGVRNKTVGLLHKTSCTNHRNSKIYVVLSGMVETHVTDKLSTPLTRHKDSRCRKQVRVWLEDAPLYSHSL
jgi:hypothetical protein